jgi:hypothetical protein
MFILLLPDPKARSLNVEPSQDFNADLMHLMMRLTVACIDPRYQNSAQQ